MKAVIGVTLLKNLTIKNRYYDIWDTKLKGFHIRVGATGIVIYRCRYKHNGVKKCISIGSTEVLTPAQARDKAKEILGEIIQGNDPKKEKNNLQEITLRNFLVKEYEPWVIANRKTGQQIVHRIKNCFFKDFAETALTEIVARKVEKWVTNRKNNHITNATIKRDIVALKSLLSKAVEWEFIAEHPLAKYKLPKIDAISKLRYLEPDELGKLLKALDLRQEKLKAERSNANAWRERRGYPLLPELSERYFVDYVKPMVLLTLNTGLRRGELFSLQWKHVNFENATLTIAAENAKSSKTRHIPLNKVALNLLQEWKKQTDREQGYLFLNDKGLPFGTVKKVWANVLKLAGIKEFRWHDLRHHFASSLVMSGVDLNTVRALLGHADIQMTLRYAHLSPRHNLNAVEKLESQFM